jgi:hypothetical protein
MSRFIFARFGQFPNLGNVLWPLRAGRATRVPVSRSKSSTLELRLGGMLAPLPWSLNNVVNGDSRVAHSDKVISNDCNASAKAYSVNQMFTTGNCLRVLILPGTATRSFLQLRRTVVSGFGLTEKGIQIQVGGARTRQSHNT